ncbi:MAG: type IV pilus assembly protein PilM [Bacteriovoracaceae bacterium]
MSEGKSIPDQIKDLISEISQMGNTNVVGIDIGASSVKVCELTGGKGKYKLSKFSIVKLSEAAIIEDQFEKPEEIVDALKAALTQSGVTNLSCAIGLYGPNTIGKRLQMPAGTPQEIEDQVMWESEQYIPFGADVSSIGHQVLGENEGGGVDVYITAAREDLIERFQNLFKDAGLKIKIIDLNIIALNNIFEHSMIDMVEKMEQAALIIDAGAQSVKMLVYKNRAPIFNREINFGGHLITEEIQRQMGVSFEEAEDLKINGDESGNLPEEILQIINSSLQTFFAEVKKSLNFFLSTSTEDKIEICYITGGSSLLPGLKEGVQKMLEVEVEHLNPLRRIEYDNKAFSGAIKDTIISQGSIAIGLSMRRP